MPTRPPPPPPTTDIVPGESPEDVHPIRLARILAEKWSTLTESAREVIREELVDGGVIAPASAKKSSASAVEQFVKLPPGQEDIADLKMEVLRTRLKMNEARYAGALNLVDLLGLLAELTGHTASLGDLLSTVWGAWHTLSRSTRLQPSSASRRPLIEHLRESLDARPGGDLNHALKDQLTAARLLIAILSGLGQGSQNFAREISKFLDPDVIYREMRQSRGGRTPTPEDLWSRYKQLSNSLTPGEIEHLLQKHIVEAAEAFFHAVHRG
jgi:hypothetical protein